MQTRRACAFLTSAVPLLSAHRWALAMRIVGSFSPNSAVAERVFSLLKSMYGDEQMSALADMIQTALMLKYNQRAVG